MTRLGIDILHNIEGGQKSKTDWRPKFVITIVFFAFLFLAFWTLKLGLSGTDKTRSIQVDSISTTRADIVDRNGEILAKNIYTFDLILNARKIQNADKAALFIHSIFSDISVNDFLRYAKTDKGYIELKKNINKDSAMRITTEKIEGLSIVQKQIRQYPKGNSMAHIIGFLNKDGNGVQGMEAVANTRLKTDETKLELSIDSRVQSIVWSELSNAMQKYKAKSAMGIVMNARTGEILAIAEVPDFNPENINAFPIENFKFRILRDNFETGSIFKIFNTTLALENGIPITKTYNIVDPFIVGGRRIQEAYGFKPPAKNLSVAQIMQYSCNVGSAQIALSLPDTAQLNFFRKLKFNQALDLDFGRTERPLFPTSNTPTDRSRWSFGHGIAVTPMHVLLAANAISNEGLYINPTIYKRNFVPETESMTTQQISRQIRQIMYMVGDTSAKVAAMQIQGLHIGGKTSTAQKFIDGKYSNNKNLTAFFATFPIEAPKWSMLIMLDEPEGYPRTSAWNAVPTAGNIMNAIIPLL